MSEPAVCPDVYKAILRVQQRLLKHGIKKTRKNTEQHFMFRSIDDVYAALSPALVGEDLCVLASVTSAESVEMETRAGGKKMRSRVVLTITFYSTRDGSSHIAQAIGEAMDSGDKSIGKAISYAYKSLVLLSFCVPADGDNDPDNTSHQLAPVEPDEKFSQSLADAADGGSDALRKAWNDIPEDKRKLLKGKLVGFKKIAKAKDATANA